MKPAQDNSSVDVFKRAQLATMKALAEDHNLEVRFGADAGSPGEHASIPLPRPGAEGADINSIRGAADHLAFKRRFHDQRIHYLYRPKQNPARDVFEWVEDARIAAIAASRFQGVALNLDAELESRFRKAFLDTVSGKSSAPLEIALGLIVKEALTDRPLPAAAENVARFWRDDVKQQVGPELDRLRESMYEQSRFAEHVLRMLALLGFAAIFPDQPDSFARQDPGAEEAGQEPAEDSPENSGPEQESSTDKPRPDQVEEVGRAELATEIDSSAAAANPAHAGHSVDRIFHYRAFTREFDKVVRAEDLCGPEELDGLRSLLDTKLAPLQQGILKLASRLQRHLLVRQKAHWMANLDEGMLDTTRLASFITEGIYARAYKQEEQAATRNTVLTILLDSSGSMRGKPIAMAAMCADILGRTMERCGVKVEILGFTTQDWRGGQSRRRWTAAGQPPEPGRLNDLLHVIYKGADEPWRKARRRLGLLMREELLKENVDGEALLWAHGRLLARPESRRILMIISDGLPADTSTLQANGQAYLEQHLRQVINRIEKHSSVELVAIGIGHDVTRFYRRAVAISNAGQLGLTMASQLAALFASDIPSAARAAKIFPERV